MDNVSPSVRSCMMASIHSKNTKPEITIRKALHARGFRFRSHSKRLPGSPDIVLLQYKAAIQINGCFWHGHNCHIFKLPKTRIEFWQSKISNNQARDTKNKAALLDMGWRLMVVWECAIQGKAKLESGVLVDLIENWILVGNDFVEVTGAPCRNA